MKIKIAICKEVPHFPACHLKWLKTESEHLLQNGPTTGGHRPSLRNFSVNNENKVFCHFIDLGWFDMSDIAYSYT